MRTSLRTRLILSFLGVIVATAALVALLANRLTAQRFTVFVTNAGQGQARMLAPLFADYYVQTGSWAGVGALLQSSSATNHGPMMMHGMYGRRNSLGMMNVGNDRLLLFDADGRLVADSAGESSDLRLSPTDLAKGAPILVGDEQVGTLVVASALGALTPDQSAFLGQINALMALAAVGAGLAVLLIGSWQAQRIVGPVRALADAARRLAAGDLSQRLPVTSHDELGDMAQAFNAMAAQLEQQHTLRRRAMADIAHELRTPLSVLRIDLESIEDGLTQATPQTIARLQEEVNLLDRLVEDLRTLSLAEAGELQMHVEPLDVCELVRAVLERVSSAAREQEVTVEADLPVEPLTVAGDRHRLSQVLLNLLSNALRHTPTGGRVTVSARRVGDQVHVSVRDTGEGIPPDQLPYVFERLYRTDRARSRDKGGSGLGLSIARSLVEAHGGRIWVESVEGQGSTFSLALPLAAAGS